MTAGTDRVEHLVEHTVQELLASTVTDTTLHILLLQFIERFEFRPELSEVLISRESLHVGEHGIALQVSRLLHTHARLTIRHLLHLLPNGLLIIAQIDAVAQTLAHLLLTIGTRKATANRIFREQDLRFHQYRRIDLIESAHQFTGHLQHRLLVLTSRNGSSLEGSNIGSLAHRIAEEAQWDIRLKVTHLDFRLHGRISLHARYRDEVHQVGSQLSQFRNHTLDIERTFLRIKTSRKVVESHLSDILSNLLRVISIVSQRLNISHEHKHFVEVASILQLHTSLKRTDIMTQMKFTSRTVSRQYNLSHLLTIYYF